MSNGLVENLTPFSAHGWAVARDSGTTHVVAEHRGRVLGFAAVDIERPDLAQVGLQARAFRMAFAEPVPARDLADVRVSFLESTTPLPMSPGVVQAERPPTQVFVVGSPRSGTSAMSVCLAGALQVPCRGELHAGPRFLQAAAALHGDPESSSDMVKLLAAEAAEKIVIDATRRFYHLLHGSESFVDKTPGAPMIKALPFLQICFPEARIIFMRRNGISNILSRMAKFGGSFAEHCADWANAMLVWERARPVLRNVLEVEQEVMLRDSDAVARTVTQFLGRPEVEDDLALSLSLDTTERTGAGLDGSALANTGWDGAEIEHFRRVCGPVMGRWGYPLE